MFRYLTKTNVGDDRLDSIFILWAYKGQTIIVSIYKASILLLAERFLENNE